MKYHEYFSTSKVYQYKKYLEIVCHIVCYHIVWIVLMCWLVHYWWLFVKYSLSLHHALASPLKIVTLLALSHFLVTPNKQECIRFQTIYLYVLDSLWWATFVVVSQFLASELPGTSCGEWFCVEINWKITFTLAFLRF